MTTHSKTTRMNRLPRLSVKATASNSVRLCLLRSVPLGKYSRSRPLAFSLVPRRALGLPPYAKGRLEGSAHPGTYRFADSGEAALKAALHPAAGPWLYFVVTDPKRGTLEFATSGEEYREFAERAARARLPG
jgi:cell division protein YceG involved in septum cleavage